MAVESRELGRSENEGESGEGEQAEAGHGGKQDQGNGMAVLSERAAEAAMAPRWNNVGGLDVDWTMHGPLEFPLQDAMTCRGSLGSLGEASCAPLCLYD